MRRMPPPIQQPPPDTATTHPAARPMPLSHPTVQMVCSAPQPWAALSLFLQSPWFLQTALLAFLKYLKRNNTKHVP
jgi:hypothetical protein